MVKWSHCCMLTCLIDVHVTDSKKAWSKNWNAHEQHMNCGFTNPVYLPLLFVASSKFWMPQEVRNKETHIENCWFLSWLYLPFCFKSSHISNCLASVFTFLSRLTWLHPWLHPWWPRSNWKRYPFGATRPFTGAHQVARSLEVVEPKPHGVSTGKKDGSVMSTTWGLKGWPPTTCKSRSGWLLIWITCKEDSLDTRQFSSLFRIQKTTQSFTW